MKKFVILPISLIVLAIGLLSYELYFKKFFEEPKIIWDVEISSVSKNSMKIKGDTVIIEEEFLQRQLKNGEGIQILDKKRAICSKSQDKCIIEQWQGKDKGWKEIGKCKLSDLLGTTPPPKEEPGVNISN